MEASSLSWGAPSPLGTRLSWVKPNASCRVFIPELDAFRSISGTHIPTSLVPPAPLTADSVAGVGTRVPRIQSLEQQR